MNNIVIKKNFEQALNAWPFYVPLGGIARYLAIWDILRSTLTAPGHLAEFGVNDGTNLIWLAKLIRLYDLATHREIHAFDSFEGLTEFSPEDGVGTALRGTHQGNLEELQNIIKAFDFTYQIKIHKGFIEETLPALMKEDPALSFSFIYCDTDLYASTKVILDCCHERLSPGGVFVMDEWNYSNLPGETVAVREFLKDHSGEYIMEANRRSDQPSLVLRKR